MNIIQNFKKILCLLILFVAINLSLSDQNYIKYQMEITIEDEELNPFIIRNNDENWIPSLLSPILLVSPYETFDGEKLDIPPINDIRSYFKRLDSVRFTVVLYNYTFLNVFNAPLGKASARTIILGERYYGLSSGNCFYNGLETNYFLLDKLKNNGEITNRIFSFDKWKLNDNLITSFLYFGDSHENFTKNEENGIIGSCKTNNSDPFWGCYFNTISFKGKEIPLKNSTHKYKIYFSSENHEILFPMSFENYFQNLTENHCGYNSSHYNDYQYYVTCDNFFIGTDTEEFNLTNENMTITVEIDSLSKYHEDSSKKSYTRIRFEEIDFFIFPLIMFKQFHIEFNKEKELISFYTKNSSILYITEKDEEENNTQNNEKSSGLKTFLIIFFNINISF